MEARGAASCRDRSRSAPAKVTAKCQHGSLGAHPAGHCSHSTDEESEVQSTQLRPDHTAAKLRAQAPLGWGVVWVPPEDRPPFWQWPLRKS